MIKNNEENLTKNLRTNRIREHPLDPPPIWQEILRFAVKLIGTCVLFIVAFTFIFGLHRNSDPDMFPRIQDGDLVMFYRLDKNYSIGDLILLDFKGKRQIRRVVAKAGDTVDIKDDRLIINGAAQQEARIYQKTQRYANDIALPLTLDEGQVFVLGDARENATDSRVYGAVNTKDTLGKTITILRRRNF